MRKMFLSSLTLLLVVLVTAPLVSPALAGSSIEVSHELVDKNLDGFKDVVFSARNGLGSGVPGVEIELYFEDPLTLAFKGATDNGGKLVILSIPPGEYLWKSISPETSDTFAVEAWTFSLDAVDETILSVLMMEAAQHSGVESTERCRSLLSYVAALLNYEEPQPVEDYTNTDDDVEIASAWFPYVDNLISELDTTSLIASGSRLDKNLRLISEVMKFTTFYYIKEQLDEVIWIGGSLGLKADIHRINVRGTAGYFVSALIPAFLDLYQLPELIRVTFIPDESSPQSEWQYVDFPLQFTRTLADTAAAWYWGVTLILKTRGMAEWTKYMNYANIASRIATAVNIAILAVQIYHLIFVELPNYPDLGAALSSPEVQFELVEIGFSVGILILNILLLLGASSLWIPVVGIVLVAILLAFTWWWQEYGPGYEQEVRDLKIQMSQLLTNLVNLKESLDNVDFDILREQASDLKEKAEALGELAGICPPDLRYSLMSKYYHLKEKSMWLSEYIENGASLKETGDLDQAIKTALHWESADGNTVIDAIAHGVNSTEVDYDDLTFNATLKYPHNDDGADAAAYDYNDVWVESDEVKISHNLIYGDEWRKDDADDLWYGDQPYEIDDQDNRVLVTINTTDVDHPLDFDYVDQDVDEEDEGILETYEENGVYSVEDNGFYFHYKYYPTEDWSTSGGKPVLPPDEWQDELKSNVEEIQDRIQALSHAAENLARLNSNPPQDIPFHIVVTPDKKIYSHGEASEIQVYIKYMWILPVTQFSWSANLRDQLGNVVTSYSRFFCEFDLNNEYEDSFEWIIPEDAESGWYKISVDITAASGPLGIPLLEQWRRDDNPPLQPIFYLCKLQILQPSTENPAKAGDRNDPNPVYIAVTGIPKIPSFDIYIGGLPTQTYDLVDLFFLRFGIYTLKVTPPTQENDGKYDLEITAAFDSMTISASESEAVDYSLLPPDPVEKGLAWLRTQQRQDGTWYDGSWHGGYSTYVGVTSLAALAFLNAGYDETDTTVHDAIQFILRNVKPSGAIYSSGQYRGAYETSLATMVLVATHNGDYDEIIENARDWLVHSQWDEDCLWGSVSRNSLYYGGFGYGSSSRPDLSNTQFVLLALDAAGLPKDHSLWTKVQVFLHRCQDVDFSITLNIEGEDYTVQPYRSYLKDGGFSYTPATPNSWGSMHAAGIWGLLLSDVPMSDPRTVIALEWLRDHYTWDENPGAGSSWLYYYCLVNAKALLMTGLSTIDGHNWYSELYDRLVDLKHEVAADKWYWQGSGWAESANIATAYSILALQTRSGPSPVQRLSYLTIILRSPATLTVQDPSERVAGFDYDSNAIVNQIPNSIYSGPLSEPQYVVIVNPAGGNYKTELLGLAEAPCELDFISYLGDEETYNHPYHVDVVTGEVDESDCIWGTVVSPKIIRTSPPTPPAIDVTPKELIGQLKVGETLSKAFIISETTGQKDLQHVVLTASDLEDPYGNTILAENIDFSLNDFTVPEGATEDVTATISTPNNAVPGDYSGVISVATENDGDAAIIIELEVVGRPTILNYIGDVDGQYSDYVTLKASLIDAGTEEPIADKTVEFNLCDTYIVQATTDSEGIGEATILLDQPATTCEVTARFLGDEDYIESFDTKSFGILKEDAIVDYTGDTVLPTTANTIDLRATVYDSEDGWWGDVTLISVTFRIYTVPIDLSNPIVEVGPIAVSETETTGVGVATATIGDLQENCYLVIVSLDSAHNDYYEAPTSDPVPLTVYEPTGAFVTGGGWIIDPTESHGNFGFNVKYLKSGRMQGRSIYVYRLDQLVYIVRSNAWRGLAIQEQHAFFEGKCVIQIYDPETGELVWSEGNYRFRVDVWDNDVDGGIDVYQIRALDKNGMLFHEAGSNPFGELQGGNIVIHDSRNKKP